jgi:hypothetical protein
MNYRQNFTAFTNKRKRAAISPPLLRLFKI